jgi:hypothetical protein
MDLVRVRVASFLFFCQIMSMKMFTTCMRLDCIVEHVLINILAQGKVKCWKLQEERVTFGLVNSTGTDMLKLLMIHTSKQPQCFGRWQPHEYVEWDSNKTTWM